jgi:hypothetical protein
MVHAGLLRFHGTPGTVAGLGTAMRLIDHFVVFM